MGLFDKYLKKESVEMKSYETKEGKVLNTDSDQDLKEGQKATIDGNVATGNIELNNGIKIKLSDEGVIESITKPEDPITTLKNDLKVNAENITKLSSLIESQKQENQDFKSTVLADAGELLKEYKDKLVILSAEVESIREMAKNIKEDISLKSDMNNFRIKDKGISLSESIKQHNSK